uniref:Otoraplin n=1 Tax=Podarcis muralis TaxID=64176 RepID=A0A670HV68_PODMU
MPHTVSMLMFLLFLGFTFPMVAKGIFMDKLASKKLCADQECLYAISLARAEDDYNAPDCRFINVRKGQLIYVYSKLVPERGAGEFWAGSVRTFPILNHILCLHGYLLPSIHSFKRNPCPTSPWTGQGDILTSLPVCPEASVPFPPSALHGEGC